MSGITSGSMIAMVPQDVPVANAIAAEVMKTMTGDQLQRHSIGQQLRQVLGRSDLFGNGTEGPRQREDDHCDHHPLHAGKPGVNALLDGQSLLAEREQNGHETTGQRAPQ